MKLWMRLYADGKLKNDTVCDVPAGASPEKMLEAGLKAGCYALDLPNPMILKKHVKDVRTYSLTRFLPDDFPEAVDFERMEITIFDENDKKKL